MKSPMGARVCATGTFHKGQFVKLEGNKSLMKGYIGKWLIHIDGVGAPTRVSYRKW